MHFKPLRSKLCSSQGISTEAWGGDRFEAESPNNKDEDEGSGEQCNTVIRRKTCRDSGPRRLMV